MSSTVDKRVVEMQFDNSQFENNVRTTMSTLDKLKRSLKLDGAAQGLESVNTAAKNCDMSGMGKGLETVKAKFSALQVAGITALANITNSAVNAGKRIAAAFTTEPIKAGFQEYETQMNAVQTILANTQKEHTNVKIVNKALDELNTYADKTIYNFTKMTRNIGTFTAAGVKLNTSVSAIKGIANLAAVSGSSSQQASVAMYQLSQALASGTVKLMDWNSVVNAGMGGQVFQEALIRTSEHLKTGAKQAIKANGSFRESLQTGWLTTKVLTQTLDQFSTAADTEKEYEAAVKKFVKQGYSKEQAKQMADMARTAGEAATKVKTFTQLIDTLKEAAGSGWTTTWRLIIGDFEEAKSLWTEVSDTLSKMINDSSDARNKLVEGWAKGGGRADLIDSLKNSFEGLMSIIKPIKEAFREIFPPMTVKQLLAFTEHLKDLTAKFKLSADNADRVKRIFKGLFSIVDLGIKAFTALTKPLYDLSKSKGLGNFADSLLEVIAVIGDFFTTLDKGANTKEFFSTISSMLSKIADGISKVFGGMPKIFDGASNGIKKFGDVFESICSWVSKAASKIGEVIGNVFGWIKEHVSFGDILAGLVGGGIFTALKKFGNLLDKIKDVIGKIFGDKGNNEEGIGEKFKNILDQVHEALASFTTGIKIASFVSIAIAIGILSSALSSIAKLQVKDIGKSLIAMALMFTMLNLSFKSFSKTLNKFKPGEVVKAGIALIAMSVAIKILSNAIVKLSGLDARDIFKGLVAIGIGLGELVAALKIVEKSKPSLKTAIVIIALASSCKILADALSKFSGLSWDEIGRGLAGMGGALAELTASVVVLNKFGGKNSIASAVSIFILCKSLDDIAESLKSIGALSWDEIGRGLAGMGGALAELGLVAGLLGKFGGMSSIAGALSILIMVKSLQPITDTLNQIGSLSWEEIGRGLAGMGGALVELGVVAGLLGKIAGMSGIVGAVTILIMVQSLQPITDALSQIGSLSWEEIARGLVGMGGALTELGLVAGLLGKLAGLSGIIGAVSILIMVQGLGDLADALKKFGEMSWEEIARGLVGMGGALTELAVISGLLGKLGGLGAILGAGSILLAIQGLGDLADALKKFGEMSWEEIGRGLTAMGAALGEVALGSLLNTLSGLGAASISAIAEPLGMLADSVKKWENVKVPEDLSKQLGSLASGIMKFTFGGLGANAISEIAIPLGILADSVRRWSTVTVPENLGENMKEIARGVESFSFAFMGGWSIDTVAGPLGTLADSIKKWSGVVIPEGIKDGLSSIASGVKSFSFAILGGWAIGDIAKPLGTLADSIKKWSGVVIPEGIKDGLSSIAAGVKSFSFAILGGWAIGDIAKPLGVLADSVSKWKGVTVPKGIKDGLSSIASGVRSFSFAFAGGWSISKLADPLVKLASAAKTLSAAKIPSDIGDKLKSIATGVKSFTGIGDISAVSNSIKSIASSSATLSKISFASVNKGLNSFVTNIKKVGGVSINTKSLTSSISTITSSISKMMKTINTTIKSGKTSISASMKTAMSGLPGAIKASTSNTTSATKSLVSKASNAIKSNKSSMSSAGKDLGNGLVQGINSKQSAVYSAGYKLGQKAVQGEKDGQKSKSPSKLTIKAGKWFGEGLVIGIDKMGSKVYSAGYNAGDTAVNAMSRAIANVTDIVNTDIDSQPTIRPVLDLDDVRAGASTLNSMFGMQPSLGVLANVGSISSMMNRHQNGTNDEVVSALKDLKNSIDSTSGDTYYFDGITYDDGSNISDAVQTLVRAARVERRR